MNEEQDNEKGINLIDVLAILWHRKVMIIVTTLIAIVGVVIYSVLSLVLPPEKSPLPNQYTPTALMLINNSSSSGSGISTMLSASGLGGLSALAGVNASASFSDLAIFLVSTNSFLDAVVDEFDLITQYKIEKFPRAESRKKVKKQLTASYDEKSGVFSLSFTDINPVFVQQVVNFCMHYLEAWFNELGLDKNKLERENLERNIENTFREIQNLEQESQKLGVSVTGGGAAATIPSIALEQRRIALELGAQQQVYTQLKVQYELLKVTMASEKPVFQILEMAEIPDQKSGPNRGMLCIIVTFAAGFFSVFLAFIMNAIANIRKDPEAMAKLRGTHT
ncbi:putative lipopolysaccharide biosynthesis protein [Treponema primitia ZAS-2]|uniref:Putative lipopolysaccharide biosynthesis protein n=1 Tax=Treponema primitia (strain ATCC BAA-887 / DSM 12427 / ZAS-2) TaxID=545694 RepID=F5YQA9_TREPZ|nr:LPS biosynthesis protein [Treponema primitia]AEF86032.1 putative lipopolysaccharide biosynthesis protein [Treponema primitia ZAS-2]